MGIWEFVGIVSITLATVAIIGTALSYWMSQKNYEKTADTLAKISERAATTESLVGQYFENMMGVVLKIVESATTEPEVRKAEVSAQERAAQASLTQSFSKTFTELLKNGDKEKIDAFVDAVERITKASS